MQNAAQGHKSSVEQSRGGDEANSDSGDSIFFSQTPLPEAMRSGGRRLLRLRSAWTQDGPAELEDDRFSSSSSEGEPRTNRKKRRRRVLRVPPCRFSFLTERKGRTNGLPRVKGKQLQSYMIGGFIKHVQELWESYERGVDVAASLPTVDVDGEGISPLSEEENDEAKEDEDIKVVERQHFATSIKAQSSKPWCASKKRSGKRTKPSNALTGSPGQQQSTEPKVSTSAPELKERPSSALQTPGDEDPLCGDLSETEAQVKSEVKTGEHPGEHSGEVLHVDEGSPSGKAACQHENGNLSQSDVSNNTLRLKKKKKGGEGACQGVEKEKEQVQDETEEELLSPSEDFSMKDVPESKPMKKKKPAAEDGRQDDGSLEEASVASRKTEADWTKKKKTVDADGGGSDPAAEPPTAEVSVRKRKKKKKKDLSVTSDLSQSPTEHHVENTDAPQEPELSFTKRKKHKKKKELPASNDAVINTDLTGQATEIVEISDAAEEDEGDINKKTEERDPEGTTKKKKQRNNWSVSMIEDAAAPLDYSASVRKKKKQKGSSSFLAADEEGSGAEERRGPSLSAAQRPDVSDADSAAKSAEHAESSEKLKDGFKKKKKRSAVQESEEGETGFEEPKGTPVVEVKKKRKCKQSDSELTSQTETCLDESQTDETVPLKKKKKEKIPAASEDVQSEASTLSVFTSDSQEKKLNKKREKEKNKLLPASPKASPKTAESCKTKQTETSSLSLKQQNKKRKLYNPSQNFLSNF